MDTIDRHYDNLVEDHLIEQEEAKFPPRETCPPHLIDQFDFDEV